MASAKVIGVTDRGLFLDLDGTLADSLAVMRAVYDRFLSEQQRAGNDEEFDRLNGPPLPEVVSILRRKHDLDGHEEDLLQRYNALIDDAYQSVSPTSGAEKLLQAARDNGRVAAIVTSNSTARTKSWLQTSGLDSLIDRVIGSEQCQRGKPDPEPYLTALALCRCAAECSLAVEDSPAGARAAHAAGLSTYVLTRGNDAGDDWPPVSGFIRRLDALVPAL